MKKYMRKYLFIGFLVVSLFVSCSQVTETKVITQLAFSFTPSPSIIFSDQTPIILDTSTVIPNPTKNITATPKPIATPEIEKLIRNVQDGDYFLIWVNDSLNLISIDGQKSVQLINLVEMEVSLDLLFDRNLLFLNPFSGESPIMLDITDGVKTNLPFLKKCKQINLMRDGKYFFGTCLFSGTNELYLISANGKDIFPLTHCSRQNGVCGEKKLSPDGNWISYRWGPYGAIQTSRIGLYLMNTNCVSSPESCENQARGPFKIPSVYEWSPDSNFIAANLYDSIGIFELRNNSLFQTKELKGVKYVDSIAWSKDSKYLVFSENSVLKKLDITNGQITEIRNFNEYIILFAWITIKDGMFNPK